LSGLERSELVSATDPPDDVVFRVGSFVDGTIETDNVLFIRREVNMIDLSMWEEVELLEGVATVEIEAVFVEGHKVRTVSGPLKLDDFASVRLESVLGKDLFSLRDMIEPLEVVSVLNSYEELFSESGIKKPGLEFLGRDDLWKTILILKRLAHRSLR